MNKKLFAVITSTAIALSVSSNSTAFADNNRGEKRMSSILSGLVSNGTITQSQADAIVKASEGGLTKKEKSIAYATAWKAKNKQQQEQADPQAAKTAAKNQQQMKAQDQMRRKQLMLQQQRLQMQKQGKLPTGHTMEEVEHVDEATRYSKETGKSFRTGKPVVKGGSAKNDKAFQMISKMMGSSRAGTQPRGQKKEPGKKPPEAGKYGGPQSPAQKVAARRAAAQRAKDMMHSRFD